MRILVCGGRDFNKVDWFNDVMNTYRDRVTHIISGGAKGADTMAWKWALVNANLPEENIHIYKADWDKHGKAAGPIRNQIMLDASRPDLVVGFPGGRGTGDMLNRAIRQNIDVDIYSIMEYRHWLKSSSQVTPTITTPTS